MAYDPSGLLGRDRHCFGNGLGIVITISGEFCVWKLKFAGFCSNFGLSRLANPLAQIWAFSRRSSAFNYLATFLCVLPADGRVPFLQDGKRPCFCRIWRKRRICCIFLCLAWYRFGMHFFLPCKSVYRVHMKCLSFNITLSHITLLIRLRDFAEIGIKIMIIPAV